MGIDAREKYHKEIAAGVNDMYCRHSRALSQAYKTYEEIQAKMSFEPLEETPIWE